MLSRFPLLRYGGLRGHVPGTGILTVFRQQMRGRRAWRDLIWTGLLVICHGAIAAGLHYAVMPAREYNGDVPRFLLRWFTMMALAGPLLYLPLAALLGAMAPPPAERFEETQSMLLTRLTPLDVCAGRLLARLWPLISALLATLALSLAVQLVWRPLLPGTADGYTVLFVVQLVLLTFSLAIGGIGFLFAMRRRPGRVWARGAVAALLAGTLCVAGLFLVNPVVRKMHDPTALIDGILLVNPAMAATSALGTDVLRIPWLYERTDAPEYPFRYPPPLATCALFSGIAAAALALCAARLRRAYR